MANKKIDLTIIYPADPLGVIPGGVDTYIRGIIRWAPDDFDVSLVGITTEPGKRVVGKWGIYDIDGKSFRFFPVLHEKDAGQRKKLPLSVRFIAGLARYRPKVDADVLDFHRIEPSIFYLRHSAVNLFVHQNMNILQNPDTDILWGKLPSLYYSLEEYVMRRVHSVITVRSDAVEWYHSRMPWLAGKVKFVPTWVDPLVFSPSNRVDRFARRRKLFEQFGFSDESKVIVTVGRLDKQKDPLLLCESFSRLLESDSSLRLLFVGDGVLRGKIEQFIQDRGLSGLIVLAGLKRANEVCHILQACDLFALSSVYEGMPMCVLEALATGLPVVSTRVGEVPRVIKDGCNGFVAEQGDADDFTRALGEGVSRQWDYSSVASTVKEFLAPNVLQCVYDTYRAISVK